MISRGFCQKHRKRYGKKRKDFADSNIKIVIFRDLAGVRDSRDFLYARAKPQNSRVKLLGACPQ